MINTQLISQFSKRNKILKDRGLTYLQFLKSKHWKSLKKYLKSIEKYNYCFICSSIWSLNFHHTTYREMFNTNFKIAKQTIVPLCIKCHHGVHKLCEENNFGLGQGIKRYKKLYLKK